MSERWEQVESLLHEALSRPLAQRSDFLREACGGDAALQRDVESLLGRESAAADFLEAPPTAFVADVALSTVMPALVPGQRLGPFVIAERLGAGGMGEVFRAQDTRLRRDVAIKILPPALTSNHDRLVRFEREARHLAALNHPNIAAIYGLETLDGAPALILELVPGETLAERIAQGPIPIAAALEYARQIASALEAAHETGIIHRDLKPANIKITPDGVVKVLDFGLARSDPSPLADSTGAPTLDAEHTREGVVMGTPAYMSPEQVRGQAVDKRTDIWAFGCVLYEVLSGQRPFKGADTADTVAAVLRQGVDWSALPPSTPTVVRHLLTRCVEKDVTRRLRDIGEARIVLSDHGATSVPAPLAIVNGRMPPMWRVITAAALAMLLAAGAAGGAVWFATRPPAPGVVRFGVGASGFDSMTLDADRPFAITADGARVIYVGNNGTQLFVRALDQLEPRIIASGVGLRAVSVSPDDQWVGFVDSSSILKKVAITGGPAVIVKQMDAASRGVTWASNDTIIFGTNAVATGLQQVSAAGGEPVVLSRPDAT